MIGRTTMDWKTFGTVVVALCAGCSSGGGDTYADGGGELIIMPLSRDATSTGLTLDSAELSFATISLDPCVTDAALLHTRNFSVDLFHNPAPGVAFFSSVTDFCGVTLELAPATSPDLPELYGASARFHGTTADGTAVTLTSAENVTLGFATDKALDAMKLVAGVDLDAWLKNVDLTNAETSGDGILVDADHNPDLLAAFEQSTSAAVALYVDVNSDGKLTAEELVPVASATQE